MIETKTLRPHMQGKIIQLDYDFITSLDGASCYCLTDAQVQMILAIADTFGWGTRWYSETGLIDRQIIDDLQGGLVEALMNGCCGGDDNSVLFQWSVEGHYQKSIDGGTTFEDAPENDPRNPQPRFPEFLPPDTLDARCTYASSIVNLLKTGFVDTLDGSEDYNSLVGAFTAFLATILAALSPTVIGSIIVGIAGAVLIFMIAFGVTAFQAAMTGDVWERFTCNLLDHINMDGSFDQASADAVWTQCAVDESGMAAIFLQAFVATAGAIGLTNAARSGNGAADANCDVCSNCNASIWTVAAGDIVSQDACTIVITPRTADSRISLTTGSSAICGYYSIAGVGVPSLNSVWPCGSGSPVANQNTEAVLNWNYDSGNFINGNEYTFTFHNEPVFP